MRYFIHTLKISFVLLQLGLERCHGVGILGFNSAEWFISDIGAILAGWVSSSSFLWAYVTDSDELSVSLLTVSLPVVLLCNCMYYIPVTGAIQDKRVHQSTTSGVIQFRLRAELDDTRGCGLGLSWLIDYSTINVRLMNCSKVPLLKYCTQV